MLPDSLKNSFIAKLRSPRSLRVLAGLCASLLLAATPAAEAAIASGTRYPSNEEQYILQLINRARTSNDGLVILKGLVANDLNSITASSGGTKGDGTKWATGFWKSGIQGVAESMNFYKVHPGDLKRQFMDLNIPGFPLAWDANLGNVASGYGAIVIASKGSGSGFPHALSPYSDQGSFAAYAKRYTDGGYGPLNTINTLAENIAPNFYSSPLSTFAGFMIDWGATSNGIQSQDPNYGSHRLSLLGGDYVEIGISRQSGWTTGNVTEVQEFGRRFTSVPRIVGSVFKDNDSNGFYTPGEGQSQVTVTATPVGGGTAVQTTTFKSGGYALPIVNPGDYIIAYTSSEGLLKTTTTTVGNENIVLDAIVTAVVTPPPPPPPVDPPPTDPNPPTDPIPPVPTSEEPTDFNGDGKPDYVLFFSTTRRTMLYYLDGVTKTGQADGPTLSSGWIVGAVADFNDDGHADYFLYNTSTRRTQVQYMNGAVASGTAAGPTLLSGWTVVGAGDFNADGRTDVVLYKKGQTMIWYLDGVTLLPGNPAGPVIPSGFVVAGVADFNADSKPDLLIFNTSTRATTVYYMDGPAKTGEAKGITAAKGWAVVGAADFNADSRPDFLLYQLSTRKTEVRYMNNVTETGFAAAPILPSGSVLVSP